ncbi:DUF366 family protein [Methanocaldococcus infernus]|nr:DUF366 family protein [Methanocaldococcus infernus]
MYGGNYMDIIILNDNKLNLKYTGKELSPLWAFKTFGTRKDSIVAFIGEMEVSKDNMKDLADVKKEFNIDYPIKSEKAINFIVEHFDTNNIKVAYLRQRLLVMMAKEVLNDFGVKVRREGDDLYIGDRKLSVSIASSGLVSHKIHLGLNVSSKGPEHVKVVGLEEFLNENEIKEVMKKIAHKYVGEVERIERDIRKTLPIL